MHGHVCVMFGDKDSARGTTKAGFSGLFIRKIDFFILLLLYLTRPVVKYMYIPSKSIS